MKRIFAKSRWMAVLVGMVMPAALYFSFREGKPADLLYKQAMDNHRQLERDVDELARLGAAYREGKTEVQRLRKQITKLRISYKKNEFLYEYFYPQYVKLKINGAPLPHLDPYYPRPSVLEPKGLQRLDELIYTDEVLSDSASVAQLSRELKSDFRPVLQNFQSHPLVDREVFEAARLQIIRIFSLGVTGFDTPGSLNALEEAAASLQNLRQVFKVYADLLPAEQKGFAEALDSLFTKAVNFCQSSSSFDDFDRLTFLTDFVNPLYGSMWQLQQHLGIESINEVTQLPQAVNYDKTNIFDEDFLNPYFYSLLSEQEDSKKLRKLGEKLFYDKRISGNGTLSCGSCHHPDKAFSDGEKTSVSNDGKYRLMRNAPGLLNSVFSKRFFGDMRARKFDDQLEHVVVNQHEFATNYQKILEKLDTLDNYKDLFNEAFPNEEGHLSRSQFTRALASYLISLRGFNSIFDRYVRGELEELEPKVKKGFNLFMGKAACGTCHFAPTFAGLVPPRFDESESEVLGILKEPGSPEHGIDTDPGRIASGIPKEEVYFYQFSFKTPTVRNVAFTAPYFHNGAYQNLEQVMDFYNHGGAAGAGLKLDHQTLPADSLKLSSEESKSIVAFMEALSDTSFGK